MATTPWGSWLDDVMPYLPGATVEIAKDAIKKAAIEFCDRTRIVRQTIDDSVTESGVTEYDISQGTGVDIVAIESVSLDGAELFPANKFCSLDLATKSLVFDSDPLGAYSLSVVVSIKPTNSAEAVDSTVFDRHRSAVASGALARLLVMPKKPWTDLASAAYHDAKFNEGIRSAQAFVDTGGTSGPLRSMPLD